MNWNKIKSSLLDDSDPFKVTGGMVKSINICERQAYFHQQDVDVVGDNQLIQIGNLIEERFYDEEDDEILIIDGMISPDQIDNGIIYETKKSSGAIESSKLQLEYYIWYLKETRGRKYDGVIRIPEERKTEEIDFDDIREDMIKESIMRLYVLYTESDIPRFEKIPACKNCAYKDICWGGNI
jgi:CRISPR-associated exonuclease Cas4